MSSCQCRVSCTMVPPPSRTAACRWISKRTARSTARSEFTFFVSERVPNVDAPLGMRDTLASQRTLPRSIRASEMPRFLTISRMTVT
ncbi:hypothetical protein BJF77_04615 [Kocuria sp. CNJ-770]|nr:hypothetical protein BJF77_04615 [Kocuria sp. CNJ-770]